MDDLLRALPVPTAMLAAAVLGLWKALMDERAQCKAERIQSETDYRKLAKDYVELSTKHEIALDKLARLSARSSNPPRT